MLKLRISKIINLKSFIHEKLLPAKRIRIALASNYPDASDIEWAFKNNSYEATFSQEGIYKIACFDETGKVKEEKVTRSEKQLPEKIRQFLYGNYNMHLLVSATEIRNQQKRNLEIIFDSHDKSRYLLLFDENGQLLQEKLLFAMNKDLISSSKIRKSGN